MSPLLPVNRLSEYLGADFQASVEQVRAALNAANLTNAKAGKLLRVNPRTVRKWTAVENPQKIPYCTWYILLIFAYHAEGPRSDDALLSYEQRMLANLVVLRLDHFDELTYWQKLCLVDAVNALNAGMITLGVAHINAFDLSEDEYSEHETLYYCQVEQVTAEHILADLSEFLE